MKTYPKYKDSGVPWLGCIPEHWDIKPGFSIFREKQVKNKGAVENRVLSLSYGKIIIKPEEKLRGLVPESFETYQIVDKGDIIIRSTDMQNDHTSLRTGIVNNKGIITSAYICLHSIDVKFCNYNYWLLHGLDLMKVFYGLGSGLRQNLSWIDFKRLPLPIPSQDEQIQISRYLDWQTSKINKFIKAKKKLIILLKEQKQNIINEAVTKGINPSVQMKDSGVAWIGEIPENWEVKKFGRCFSFGRGLPIKKSDLISEGVAVISYGQIHAKSNSGTHISNDLIRYVHNEYLTKKPQCLLNKNDFVFADTSEDIEGAGNCAFNDYELPVFAGYHSVIARPVNLSYPKFYAYLFQSTNWKLQVQTHVNGVKVYSINRGILRSTCILIPPLSEQRAIVNFLEKETVLIDKTISRTEQEIELIQEYRTRLVSDVVTGQVDVRSVEIPDFNFVEMEQDVEGDEEMEDELITESIEE